MRAHARAGEHAALQTLRTRRVHTPYAHDYQGTLTSIAIRSQVFASFELDYPYHGNDTLRVLLEPVATDQKVVQNRIETKVRKAFQGKGPLLALTRRTSWLSPLCPFRFQFTRFHFSDLPFSVYLR